MARIDGELKNAQFEEVSSLPAGPQPKTRFVQFGGTPYMWKDGAWKELQTEPYIPPPNTQTQLFSQDATTDTTVVDWSTGLNQEVVLKANTVISFINPQNGYVHKLKVTQNNTSSSGFIPYYMTPRYAYFLDMDNQDVGNFLLHQVGYSPNVDSCHSYEWNYKQDSATTDLLRGVNFNAVYSNGAAAAVHHLGNISPDGKSFIAARNGVTTVDLWQLNNTGNFFDAPISGVLSSPAPSVGLNTTTAVIYNPENRSVGHVSNVIPFVQCFGLRGLDNATLGTAYANPSTLPSGSRYCADWNKFGTSMIIGGATTPFMEMYTYDNNSPLVKSANPASLPATTVCALSVNKVFDAVATLDIQSQLNSYIIDYNNWTNPFLQGWDNTKSQMVALPTGAITLGTIMRRLVAWHPSGKYIAYKKNGESGPIAVRPYNPTTNTYGSELTVSIPDTLWSLNWSPDGRFLVMSAGSVVGNVNIYVFDFKTKSLNGTNISISGSAYAAFTSASGANDINIHQSGKYFILTWPNSPWITSVPMPQDKKEYFRIA